MNPVEAVLPSSPISNDRILGVIPNFQTVSDPTTPYVPLRVHDKWGLFVKESIDPFAFFSAAAGAGISQWHNEDPKYGCRLRTLLQRFGAAQADLTSGTESCEECCSPSVPEFLRCFLLHVLPRGFVCIQNFFLANRAAGLFLLPTVLHEASRYARIEPPGPRQHRRPFIHPPAAIFRVVLTPA